MIPLVDIHCHLLAGLDDGPRTQEEALAMCRLAHEDGTRLMVAGAHQNEHYPHVTPEGIRQAHALLEKALHEVNLPLTTFPIAEVMVSPDLEARLRANQLMTIAGRGQYLLIEYPHGLFVDLRGLVTRLVKAGVRPILAHPERQPELMDEPELLEALVELGCLTQVSASSLTAWGTAREHRVIKDWLKRGVLHLLGSDGHSPTKRPPVMGEAYQTIVSWVGTRIADRVGSTYGMAILQGLPLHIPPPEPRPRRWFALWR